MSSCSEGLLLLTHKFLLQLVWNEAEQQSIHHLLSQLCHAITSKVAGESFGGNPDLSFLVIVSLSLYCLRNSHIDCFDIIIPSSDTKYSTIDEIWSFQCKERIRSLALSLSTMIDKTVKHILENKSLNEPINGRVQVALQQSIHTTYEDVNRD